MSPNQTSPDSSNPDSSNPDSSSPDSSSPDSDDAVSAPQTTGGESRRLTAARERVIAAQDAVDDARNRLAATARGSTITRRRVAMSSAAVGVIVAIAAVIASLLLRTDGQTTATDEVVASASTAVAMILTADPAHPDRYLEAARSVSGGDYRRRIDAAGPAIEAAVAELGSAGTGQVVAAGVVGGTTTVDGPADVLVVAQTTAPQLVGGGAGDRRIVLSVTMIRESGSWVIGQVALR